MTGLVIVGGMQLLGSGLLVYSAASSASSLATSYKSNDAAIGRTLTTIDSQYWKMDDDLNNFVYYVAKRDKVNSQGFKVAANGNLAAIDSSLQRALKLANGTPLVSTLNRIQNDISGYAKNSSGVFSAASVGNSTLAYNLQINGNAKQSNDLTSVLPLASSQ
ncbi:hypothetical protein [Acidithrix sp. C25]|nr:hypothetical protein [Acidithrix sp. C25]